MGLFDKLFGKKEEINPNFIYAPMAGNAVEITKVPIPLSQKHLMISDTLIGGKNEH